MNESVLRTRNDIESLDAYDYDLPTQRIALYPVKPRHDARMMVLRHAGGGVVHRRVWDLPDELPPQSLLVVNNTKVFPARLSARLDGSGRPIEVFILQETAPSIFRVLFKPWKKIKNDSIVTIEPAGVPLEIIDAKNGLVRFVHPDPWSLIESCGRCPLPPYIKRAPTKGDLVDYQTIFARHRGSVAAPTAGLHFTPELLVRLKQAGHECVTVTLHVADGTFKPVTIENIRSQRLHEEYYEVREAVWKRIVQHGRSGRAVVAVGTTVCRTLETVARTGSLKGWTNLFIRPGFAFNIVDALLTNFHLPRSSLLMLACAFGGYDRVMDAYRAAVEEGYRFYSYGDCMLMRRM